MGIGGGKYAEPTRLDGKTVVVTGCNTGIGKITAQEFYRLGARVIMACRDISRAEEAAKEIKVTVLQGKKDARVGEIIIHKLELGSLASVRECANKILETEQYIHILVNNAGVMSSKSNTEDGFESQFGINHLGHFLFTCLLLPRIIKSSPARIINVSSALHERAKIDFNDLNWEKRSYSSIGAYGQSKLANILFTAELTRRLKEKGINGVNTYSLHPGVVNTDIGRNWDSTFFNGASRIAAIFSCFTKTPEQGAQTTLHCALNEAAGNETGLYYSDSKVKMPSRAARDKESATKLWEVSLKLVGIENFDLFTEAVK